MKFTRHTGQTTIGHRCVVVYMSIPGREDHALIAITDSMPDRIEHALLDVVNSNEGQADPILANVLGRRVFGDTGENLLATLHSRGLLLAVPQTDVLMVPHPSKKVPLTDIIAQMGDLPTSQQTKLANEEDAATNRVDRFAEARAHDDASALGATAQSLLTEAEMLETEAASKRARAYEMAPALRPEAAEEAAEKSAED
jgi:hypothetical protein